MEMTPKLKQAVKEYKSGKAESFDTLYKESEKYIYTCIYKVMSGNNNAVDITGEIMQNTYLQIFLNISQLENEDRFLSWAGTIATRECFAYIKKNKKYVLLNEDDDTFENLSDSDDIIPEEVMQSKEKRRLVREIIDTQLNEVQKICIYEFYYNQKKQTEIADRDSRHLWDSCQYSKNTPLQSQCKNKGRCTAFRKERWYQTSFFCTILCIAFQRRGFGCNSSSRSWNRSNVYCGRCISESSRSRSKYII